MGTVSFERRWTVVGCVAILAGSLLGAAGSTAHHQPPQADSCPYALAVGSVIAIPVVEPSVGGCAWITPLHPGECEPGVAPECIQEGDAVRAIITASDLGGAASAQICSDADEDHVFCEAATGEVSARFCGISPWVEAPAEDLHYMVFALPEALQGCGVSHRGEIRLTVA